MEMSIGLTETRFDIDTNNTCILNIEKIEKQTFSIFCNPTKQTIMAHGPDTEDLMQIAWHPKRVEALGFDCIESL